MADLASLTGDCGGGFLYGVCKIDRLFAHTTACYHKRQFPWKNDIVFLALSLGCNEVNCVTILKAVIANRNDRIYKYL